jgi:hypothetical protein
VALNGTVLALVDHLGVHKSQLNIAPLVHSHTHLAALATVTLARP